MNTPDRWYDKVQGIREEAVRSKFRDAPTPLTEEWCRSKLWWWHNLANGTLPARLMSKFDAYNSQGAAEAFLTFCEAVEWEARVKGTAVPAPMDIAVPWMAHVSSKKWFRIEVSISDRQTEKEAIAAFLSVLRSSGWSEPRTQTLYARPPRVTGPDNWADMFSAIEIVDRRFLLSDENLEYEERQRQGRQVTGRINRKSILIGQGRWKGFKMEVTPSGRVLLNRKKKTGE